MKSKYENILLSKNGLTRKEFNTLVYNAVFDKIYEHFQKKLNQFPQLTEEDIIDGINLHIVDYASDLYDKNLTYESFYLVNLINHNLELKFLRLNKRKAKEMEKRACDISEVGLCLVDYKEPLECILYQEDVNLIRRLVESKMLTKFQREVVMKYCGMEGHTARTFEEIAQERNISRACIGETFHIACDKIEKVLD